MLSAMTDTQLGAPSPPGRSIAPSRPLAAGGDVPEAEATPSPPTGLMEAAKGEAAWGHVNHMDPLLEGDEEEDSELEAMDRSPTEMSSSSQIDIFEAVAALGIENGTFIVHDMASELSTDQSAATQSIYARGPGAPSSLQPQGEGAGFNGPYPGAGRTCSPGYPPQWPRPATQQQCAPSLDQEMSRSGETERACLAAQSLRQRSGDGMRGLAPVTGACKGKSPDAPAPAPAYAPTCFYDTSAIGGGDGADPATASSTHNPTALRAALHAIARAHRRFGPEVVPLQESDSESLRELLVADMDAGADTRGCDYYSTDCDAGEDETPAAGAACSQGRATTTGASAAPGTEGGGGAVLRETGLGPTAAGGAQPPRSDDAQWFSGGATLVAATEAPEARSASEGCSQELGEAALQQWAAASAPDGDVVRPLGGLRKRSRSVRVLCAEVEAGTFSDSQESVVTEESPSKRQRRGRKGRRGRGRRRRGRSRASLLSHKLRERQRSNAIRDAINGLRDVFAEPGGEAASDTAAPAAAPKSNLTVDRSLPSLSSNATRAEVLEVATFLVKDLMTGHESGQWEVEALEALSRSGCPAPRLGAPLGAMSRWALLSTSLDVLALSALLQRDLNAAQLEGHRCATHPPASVTASLFETWPWLKHAALAILEECPRSARLVLGPRAAAGNASDPAPQARVMPILRGSGIIAALHVSIHG